MGTLRVVVFPQPGYDGGYYYVAQCLEADVATQGKSLREVMESLCAVVDGYRELAARDGREPFEDVPKAPQKFWDRWDECTEVKLSESTQPKHDFALAM